MRENTEWVRTAHIELTSQVNTLQMHSQTLELNIAGELLFKTQTSEVLQTPNLKPNLQTD